MSEFVTISGLPDRRELAALLGDLTVAWSHAERMVFFAFWVSTGTNQSKAFTLYEALSGPKARFKMIKDLFDHDIPDHPKFSELIAHLQSINACGELRNEIVHRTWVRKADGELYLLDHRLKRRQPSIREISETQVRQLLAEIVTACDGILETITEIFPDAFRREENVGASRGST